MTPPEESRQAPVGRAWLRLLDETRTLGCSVRQITCERALLRGHTAVALGARVRVILPGLRVAVLEVDGTVASCTELEGGAFEIAVRFGRRLAGGSAGSEVPETDSVLGRTGS